MKLLVPIVLVVAAVVAVCAFQMGADSRRSVNPVPERVGEPTPTVTTPTAPASAGTLASAGWEATATTFVEAFLSTGHGREARLKAVATPRLYGMLRETDPARIPTSEPNGEPAQAGKRSESVVAVQHLSDGSFLEFDLVRDSSRESGWVVTSVRPGER